MKVLLRVAREAAKYKWLLIVAALSTLCNDGRQLDCADDYDRDDRISDQRRGRTVLKRIALLAFSLLGLYLFKILFRFLSNYLAHKAAWQLVQDIRMKVYNRIQSFSMGFFHNRQTGELMSRVVKRYGAVRASLRASPAGDGDEHCHARRRYGYYLCN